MTRALRRSWILSPACLLLAGLLLFQAGLAADEAPPARSIAPAADPLPVASQAELLRLQRSLEELVAEQSRRLDQSSGSLKSLQSQLNQGQDALDRARQSLADLAGRLQGLEQAQARAGVEAAAAGTRLEAQAKGLEQLRLQQNEDRVFLKNALKDLAATRDELQERSRKLSSLSDLLAVMKKDVESNHEELVEMKQTLRRFEPVAAQKSQAAWWEQALRWPYLPAVAVGLSLVAVGLAAR